MNLSRNAKYLLFVPFSPHFCVLSCPTFPSMCCEKTQKPDEKTSKNQPFYHYEIVS